jgi:death-on-curing protein
MPISSKWPQLVQNHPFVDGNKRVGAEAAATFLEWNGWNLPASQGDFTELVLSVARGEVTKSEISEFFRAHTTQP